MLDFDVIKQDDLPEGDKMLEFSSPSILKGDDILYGGEGYDLLQGGSDNDSLYGETGNDSLHGDSGNDLIDGGLDDSEYVEM